MNSKALFTLSVIALSILSFQSCSHINRATNISSYGDTESHNAGRNCMECHKNGGRGKGAFTVAGTVYQENSNNIYPNATVKLFTGEEGTGELKATIEVDGLGNFYTTEHIDFSVPLYPTVVGNSDSEHMPLAITVGQCNSCHGVTEDRISVN